MIDFKTFCTLFEMLLNVSGKTDEGDFLKQAYYEILTPTNPTSDELWAAISKHLDARGARFPSGSDLRQYIWDDRKSQQQALPAAEEKPMKVSREEAKRNRLSFIGAIYKHQGDSRLYRKYLALWAEDKTTQGIAVTHDEVMEFLGLPVTPRPQDSELPQPKSTAGFFSLGDAIVSANPVVTPEVADPKRAMMQAIANQHLSTTFESLEDDYE